jgi:hypothetical protein
VDSVELVNYKFLTETKGRKVKVFSDMHSVRNNLSGEKYQIVDDIDEADIIFVNKHFKDYK